MKKFLISLTLSLILIMTGCTAKAPAAGGSSSTSDAAAEAAADVEKDTAAESASDTADTAAPVSLANFKSIDLDGNEVDESIFADYQLTMINIWATFCGPCLREMPELGVLATEYAEKNVQIVGIVTDIMQSDDGSFDQDMVNGAKEIVQETGANYIHMLPSADLINAKLREVSAVPTTIFVDNNGNIVGKTYVGAKSSDNWAAIIDETLTEVQSGSN